MAHQFTGSTAPTVNTIRARRFLESVDHDNVITYDELERQMGFDIHLHRHNFESARRYVLREHQALFITIVGVGIKRAVPIDVAVILDNGRQSSGRQVRRLLKKSVAMGTGEGLSGHELGSAAANMVILAHIELDTRDRNHQQEHKQIEAKLGTLKQLPTRDQLTKMRPLSAGE